MSTKMVLAFVKPDRLDRVTRALERIDGFPGMTVSDARGFGREKLTDPRDERDQLTDFMDAIRLESVVPEDLVEEVTQAIMEAAHTGRGGDGLLTVLPVERAVRLRTRVPPDERG